MVGANKLWKIYERMLRSRVFDERVREAVVRGIIKCPVYLSSGQESIPASMAGPFNGYSPAIFCQHRNHAAYLSFGGDMVKLRDNLISGSGGDPMFADSATHFYGHSGLVADHVPIAVGYAMATGSPVVCFFGDSAVEEDVFWPAVGQAASLKLPVLFVCENNGLSVITRVETRRKWDAASVARGYGLASIEMLDDPLEIWHAAMAFQTMRLPTFLEIQCCRKYYHVGVGEDDEMAWDRLKIVADQLGRESRSALSQLDLLVNLEVEDVWRTIL